MKPSEALANIGVLLARRLKTKKLVAALSFVATATTSIAAHALPEAHLLRVDPRTASSNGAPILSTLIEVVELTSPSDRALRVQR